MVDGVSRVGRLVEGSGSFLGADRARTSLDACPAIAMARGAVRALRIESGATKATLLSSLRKADR